MGAKIMKFILVFIWLLALPNILPNCNPVLGQNKSYFPLRKFTVVNTKPKIILEKRYSDVPPLFDTSGTNWVYYLKSKYFNFSLDSIYYHTEIKDEKRKNEGPFSPDLYVIDIDYINKSNSIRIKYYMDERWTQKDGEVIFAFEIIYSIKKRKFLKISCKGLPFNY